LVGALILHVLLDLVPHWDYTRHRLRVLWTLLDVGAAAAGLLALFFALDLPLQALLAGILSAAPDLDVVDALLPGGPRRRWFPSHWRRFPHGSTRPGPGITVQMAVIAVSTAGVVISTVSA